MRPRPLADHVADWHAYLLAKGSTRQHADLSRNRVARIIELARLGRISELTPSKVQAAIKAIRDTGISLRSIHHYTERSRDSPDGCGGRTGKRRTRWPT